ncbi:MAG: class F sortase [Patescibacteria group bacterium]
MSFFETAPRAAAYSDVSIGIPVQIKIPSIHVDAPIEAVGLTSGSALGIPKDSANVAWHKLGPRPGEKGSAVITGHFGWNNNLPAVFDNLSLMQKGDLISTEDGNGRMTEFVVRSIRIYGSDETIPEVFVSDDGKAHLNLITCTGVWDVLKQTYSQRLVVFAERKI